MSTTDPLQPGRTRSVVVRANRVWALVSGGVLAAGAAVIGVLVHKGLLGRVPRLRTHRPYSSPSVAQIREGCQWDCDELVPLVLQESDPGGLRATWPVLHAELIDLETRTDLAAKDAHDPDTQRALDRTSRALLALRSALEAHMRLRLGPAEMHQRMLLEASASTVSVRRQDLRTVADALRGTEKGVAAPTRPGVSWIERTHAAGAGTV